MPTARPSPDPPAAPAGPSPDAGPARDDTAGAPLPLPAPPQFPPTDSPDTVVEALLARPRGQRAREYQYRCAQSLVFGLPVLALGLWGPRLGGPESARWVGLFQALLAGWVVYVGAAGMLFEAVLLARRGSLRADGAVAAAAVALYAASLLALLWLLAGGVPWWPAAFEAPVVLLAAWTGAQWYRHRHG